ncbi:MAG: MFS transporter [Bacteroidales bacterium]|nr:MFS transporter [Bacteroidales bacterium]MBP5690359.1 MFS transporter [Bacteroidales bacterium]
MDDGNYKLTWRQRIGYSSGDLAQNLIYQTVSIWLLFFYTNVFGLKPGVAAVMFLVVRIIDVIWDPIVGTLVDKANPKWGKYRSWLILGGLPLAAFAMLCFWNGFSGSLLYAYITYVGLSMCFTLINVPYGALGSSLTRDTEEITVLTSVRMFLANLAGLIIKTLPLVIAIFAPKVLNPDTGRMVAVYNTPESSRAWFITMSIFALTGLALLVFCFFESRERIVMDEKDSAEVKVSDLWMELVRNRPLRILSFFFIIAFTTMSISNAADSYFMTYNIGATPFMTTAFMWLGTIPAFIFLPLVPAIKKKIGKNGMFRLFLGIAIVGMVLMYLSVSFPALKRCFPLLCVIQFVKSTGILVATGYMWALVPEVVTFGEYTTGRRVAGIVNALICIFMKAGMALGGTIPGLVLAWVGFNSASQAQTPLAEQGILWLVTLIPALLFLLAIFVIGKYELSDKVMDEINSTITKRQKA